MDEACLKMTPTQEPGQTAFLGDLGRRTYTWLNSDELFT
jgi:hypothetical protein